MSEKAMPNELYPRIDPFGSLVLDNAISPSKPEPKSQSAPGMGIGENATLSRL